MIIIFHDNKKKKILFAPRDTNCRFWPLFTVLIRTRSDFEGGGALRTARRVNTGA